MVHKTLTAVVFRFSLITAINVCTNFGFELKSSVIMNIIEHLIPRTIQTITTAKFQMVRIDFTHWWPGFRSTLPAVVVIRNACKSVSPEVKWLGGLTYPKFTSTGQPFSGFLFQEPSSTLWFNLHLFLSLLAEKCFCQPVGHLAGYYALGDYHLVRRS